jgi:hypothetical protein
MPTFDPLRAWARSVMLRSMRKMTIPVLLLSVAGCSEQIDATYSTYADAQRAGAIERGWVPAFVPPSARDIIASHNLDTNRQTLRFAIPPSDLGKMVAGLGSVSAEDRRAAAELSRRHGLGAASEAYVVCCEPLDGALALDRDSGRAVYDTTIEWAEDDCLG